MRFEVVPAPVEQRLHSRLHEQTDTAIGALYWMVNHINNKTNQTIFVSINALSDKQYVNGITRRIWHLLAPTSLPGMLLVAACVFRLLYSLVVHVTALRECRSVPTRAKCA